MILRHVNQTPALACHFKHQKLGKYKNAPSNSNQIRAQTAIR